MSINFTSNVSSEAQYDILDLQQKIGIFTQGDVSDDAFRKFRLARGVYGQRQAGVQMIRIKLPYGRITAEQLIKIADCSDKYATGNLHATTRQDIQLHFVKLSQTPQLWADLEDAKITLREACGNTVRNVTASAKAGIDPDEPFDVSPYAHAIYEYFLRNPICQDMGRKFKIAVSSSAKDSAYAYIHDVGLIPAIVQQQQQHEPPKRGFKVLVGGGLGAQPHPAQVAHEFLEEQYVIPFIEAVIRVFDRYGERVRRHKARMKFLLADIGLEKFMELVREEQKALKNKTLAIAYAIPNVEDSIANVEDSIAHTEDSVADVQYQAWLATNVFEQKQKGLYGVGLRVLLGDMSSDTARALAAVVLQYAADDIRVTVNQGYLLRGVMAKNLPALYQQLNTLGLAQAGFDTTADITTCPGTDTCNLAISSSYGITRVLEQVMTDEFPELIYNNDIKIKISGCMNGCGQHSACNIGFHGSSIKNGPHVLPAMQVLLGGGFSGTGDGLMGDKVIKLPTKRTPNALRFLLNDYEANAFGGEYYNDYYQRQGNKYFYALLKPLADLSSVQSSEYVDWDHDEPFKTEVGVGECASVIIDLIATTIIEAQEKILWAKEAFEAQQWSDAIYHAYGSFVTSAKAMLITQEIPTNTQHGILRDFDKHFGTETAFEGLSALVLSINQHEPSRSFAEQYIARASDLTTQIKTLREKQILAGENTALQQVAYGLDS
jgi:sulfite reductase (ferredoxin)